MIIGTNSLITYVDGWLFKL